MKTKRQTKIDDLSALLSKDAAEKKESLLRGRLQARFASRPAYVEGLAESATELLAATAVTDAATDAWKRRPAARKAFATHARDVAREAADRAFALGGFYSGVTERRMEWGQSASAATRTHEGGQYSNSCRYRKTNAVHAVTMDPAGVVGLAENVEIVEQSRCDGLPLLALYPVAEKDGVATFRAIWVRSVGRKIDSVAGYVAAGGGIVYHSAASEKAARTGLKKKLAAERERAAAATATAKEKRRAALVARLCRNATATIADARAFGYCGPGIRAFQERHRIGDVAPLPDLIATGDPAAVRLALSVARKISRTAAA